MNAQNYYSSALGMHYMYTTMYVLLTMLIQQHVYREYTNAQRNLCQFSKHHKTLQKWVTAVIESD